MRTVFYGQHHKLGAKIVDFYGWEMPLQYSGIIKEHKGVRGSAGLFDVSHMGRFKIHGPDAQDLIQRIITNDIRQVADGQSLYSPMCNHNGGIVDDVIVSRLGPDDFIMVVNASNRTKDMDWIMAGVNMDRCEVKDVTAKTALLALQGPQSPCILEEMGVDMGGVRPFRLVRMDLNGAPCVISRTGYTGEDGFELLFDGRYGHLWDAILEAGAAYGIMPAGLGARDTLRLEAGMMLYGNDIDEDTTPLEAPLGWTVKMKTDFIGRDALLSRKITKRLRGFMVVGSGRVARKGDTVYDNERPIGTVTSGGFSPTLGRPIGYCHVLPEYEVGAHVAVGIGKKRYKARLASTRFYKR